MVTVDELVVKVTADSSGVTSGMEKAKASTLGFADSISRSAERFAVMGTAVDRAMNMMDRYEISQISIENATARVASAQQNYNEAVARYGEDSAQAIDASRQLEIANNNLERTNIRVNSSMVMIGLSTLSMVPQFINFGKAAVTTLRDVEIATLLTTTRIKAMVPELLVLSAVAGGVWYLWQTQTEAAASATRNATDSISAGLNTTQQQADDLKKTLEGLEGIGKTAEQRRAIRTAEYEASDKGPEATKQYNLDMLNINKQLAESAYAATEDTKEQAAALEKIKSLQSDILSLQTPGRKLSMADMYAASQAGISAAAPGRDVDISYPGEFQDMINRRRGQQASAEQQAFSNMFNVPLPFFNPERSNSTEGMKNMAEDIKRIAKEPREINMTVNITTREDPMKVMSDVGMGIRMGYNTTNILPR